MNDDLLILRLAVQNSLIGCVTSELRAVYVKIENKIIYFKKLSLQSTTKKVIDKQLLHFLNEKSRYISHS